MLVLDEADRMFDLGFIADIRFLMRRLPPPDRRLSMLFSATLSQRVLELAYEHMNNPELVRIEPDKMTVDRVRQIMYYPSMEEKLPLLIALLRQGRCPTHHDIRQHQAHGGTARISAERQRLQCPGHLRRCAAAEATALPARFPQRRPGGAHCDRRGLARSAYS